YLFFQAEDGIRDKLVTGVQTCALPISRKALKTSGGFSIPAKKTDPIEIRGEGVSHADELLAAFNKARQPKQQILAFEQIIKSYRSEERRVGKECRSGWWWNDRKTNRTE